MACQFMKFKVRDNVAWITFNRPEAFNAINFQATNEFYDIVNRRSVDTSIRAAVLTGTGERAFCAGGDVVQQPAARSIDSIRAHSMFPLSGSERTCPRVLRCVPFTNEMIALCGQCAIGDRRFKRPNYFPAAARSTRVAACVTARTRSHR